MNRPLIYSLEQIRSFDTLWGWRDTLEGIAGTCQSMLGPAITGAFNGFVPSPTAPPSLTINLTEGWIMQVQAEDATRYGALDPYTGPTSAGIMQQGYLAPSQLTFNSTSGMSGGQSRWSLVQMQFVQTDVVRTGDPNDGVLPYINTAMPNIPFEGPNNSGITQSTEREGTVVMQIKNGNAATTGLEVPPTPDAGWLPYLLVDLTFGQSAITSGQILLANNQAYSGLGYTAPYFPGVTGTVPFATGGSHHGGVAGQAAKINLNGGAEVAGIMAFPNLPVTNTSPAAVGGIVTMTGEIAIKYFVNANPNGALAGNVGDEAFNTVSQVLYQCVTSGTSSTAVWVGVGSGGISSYKNANFSVVGGNFTYQADTAGGNLVAQLPLAAVMGGSGASFINIGTNLLTITPDPTESINGGTTGASIVILPGNGITISSRSGVGWYTLTPQEKDQNIAKTGSFTANGPSGSLYTNLLSANATVTLLTSTGDGTIQQFRIDPASPTSFGQTLVPAAGQTIVNGATINTNATGLNMPNWQVGTVVLTAVPGGWVTK